MVITKTKTNSNISEVCNTLLLFYFNQCMQDYSDGKITIEMTFCDNFPVLCGVYVN